MFFGGLAAFSSALAFAFALAFALAFSLALGLAFALLERSACHGRRWPLSPARRIGIHRAVVGFLPASWRLSFRAQGTATSSARTMYGVAVPTLVVAIRGIVARIRMVVAGTVAPVVYVATIKAVVAVMAGPLVVVVMMVEGLAPFMLRAQAATATFTAAVAASLTMLPGVVVVGVAVSVTMIRIIAVVTAAPVSLAIVAVTTVTGTAFNPLRAAATVVVTAVTTFVTAAGGLVTMVAAVSAVARLTSATPAAAGAAPFRVAVIPSLCASLRARLRAPLRLNFRSIGRPLCWKCSPGRCRLFPRRRGGHFRWGQWNASTRILCVLRVGIRGRWWGSLDSCRYLPLASGFRSAAMH